MAEDILHYGGVKFRLRGSGNLKMVMYGLDDPLAAFNLIDLPITEAPNREPTRLCNVVSQRARLKAWTAEINETFKINRIIFYVKPIWTEYPM